MAHAGVRWWVPALLALGAGLHAQAAESDVRPLGESGESCAAAPSGRATRQRAFQIGGSEYTSALQVSVAVHAHKDREVPKSEGAPPAIHKSEPIQTQQTHAFGSLAQATSDETKLASAQQLHVSAASALSAERNSGEKAAPHAPAAPTHTAAPARKAAAVPPTRPVAGPALAQTAAGTGKHEASGLAERRAEERSGSDSKALQMKAMLVTIQKNSTIFWGMMVTAFFIAVVAVVVYMRAAPPAADPEVPRSSKAPPHLLPNQSQTSDPFLKEGRPSYGPGFGSKVGRAQARKNSVTGAPSSGDLSFGRAFTDSIQPGEGFPAALTSTFGQPYSSKAASQATLKTVNTIRSSEESEDGAQFPGPKWLPRATLRQNFARVPPLQHSFDSQHLQGPFHVNLSRLQISGARTLSEAPIFGANATGLMASVQYLDGTADGKKEGFGSLKVCLYQGLDHKPVEGEHVAEARMERDSLKILMDTKSGADPVLMLILLTAVKVFTQMRSGIVKDSEDVPEVGVFQRGFQNSWLKAKSTGSIVHFG